jgi:hypothetical protein
MCNVEYKKSIIESTINSARQFYNKTEQSDVDDDNIIENINDEQLQDDYITIMQMNETEQSNFIINKIQTKVKLLLYLWKNLNKKTNDYNTYLLSQYESIQQLNKIFDLINQKLNENEHLINGLKEINREQLINENDKLAENLDRIKNIQLHLTSYQPLIDDMNLKHKNLNDNLNRIDASSIDDKCNDLNKRWLSLNNTLQEKYNNLYNLIESSGANIFLKLSESVSTPWQRCVSQINKLPYYMNHTTETTTWEHPKMSDLYKSFNNLNDIRFSAYRTSMKLRTLQKRLWLDLVDIKDVISAFDKHGLKNNINERNIEINQIILCLNTLFQPACKQHSQIINLVHAVDLTLNWLLSVYDP